MTDAPGTALSQMAIHGSFTVERDLTASPDRVIGGDRGPRQVDGVEPTTLMI